MNNMKLVFVLAATLVLGGCAITPPISKTESGSARIESAVTTPGLDGVAATVVVVDMQNIDPSTGKSTGIWNRSVHFVPNAPLVGELLKGLTATAPAALIQGEAIKRVAKIGKCADGANCGTIINSVANSASQSTNATNIGIGLPCLAAGNCAKLGD